MGARKKKKAEKPGDGENGWVRAAASLAFLTAFFGAGIAILARPLEPEPETVTTMERCARESGLDPRLVEAVITCESGGRSGAVSRAGAVGLMQVMPATAAEVSREVGLPEVGREDLFDPEINVKIGTHYLAKMIRKFGDIHLALAAYNAGPANVRRWIASHPGRDGASVIRRAAFPETRAYVERVMAEWKGE